METKTLGRLHRSQPYLLSHGEPTFRCTRIRVTDVLKQIASGMAYEAIIEEWRGILTRYAIAEAVCISHLLPEDYMNYRLLHNDQFKLTADERGYTHLL